MDADQRQSRMAVLDAYLGELLDEAVALEDDFAELIEKIPALHRSGAANLLHYLALRRHDLRAVQSELHALGLSSLGRSEAYVLRSLEAVLAVLDSLQGRASQPRQTSSLRPEFAAGRQLLQNHTAELLGPPPVGRRVRIMVTMPSEAAERYDLVRELIRRGMDVMRINCASDSLEEWGAMIDHARRAEQELGRSCRVLCDLAGPNPRTGPISFGPGLVRWAPLLDSRGHVCRPARIWLAASREAAPPEANAVLPVSPDLLRVLQPSDQIRFTDTRGRACWVSVQCCDSNGCWAEGSHTAVLEEGLLLSVVRSGQGVTSAAVGAIPPVEQCLSLRVGEELVITSTAEPGKPADLDERQRVVHPAHIGCTFPETFRAAKAGQRIFFDDGRLSGVIREVADERLRVEIVAARKGEAKLRSGKSINLPDTDLHLDALTDKDRADLDFAASHADMVGLSFVRHAADVECLLAELDKRDQRKIGIVLKLETRQAFEELPRLLLTAMQRPPIGVMVARGDMGVELGFERLAEVQEEILWICEAAHVPTIWATQVLETMAKKGLPSRAEVTDAAMAGRAECVMLNKGPHVVHTVEFLSDVLGRMQEHQEKKLSMFRKLHVSKIK